MAEPERAADEKVPPTSKLAPVIDAPLVRPRSGGPLTVAIVGSGPAAMYAADELLTQHGVRVNVFEHHQYLGSTVADDGGYFAFALAPADFLIALSQLSGGRLLFADRLGLG